MRCSKKLKTNLQINAIESSGYDQSITVQLITNSVSRNESYQMHLKTTLAGIIQVNRRNTQNQLLLKNFA